MQWATWLSLASDKIILINNGGSYATNIIMPGK